MQAGEALVNIEISEKRVGVIKKTVTFTPTVCLPGTIYIGGDFSISGLSLDPYPTAGQSIDLENYTLKLLVSKTQ